MINTLFFLLQREYLNIINNVPSFVNYYNLRDALPFYITLIYLLSLADIKKKFMQHLAKASILFTVGVTLTSVYMMVRGIPNTVLTGFKWRYVAPIQYGSQIVLMYWLVLRQKYSESYAAAVAWNAAAATGYLYEVPYWFYSVKDTWTLIHVSYRFTFFVSWQLIAVPVFICLLRKQGVVYRIWDLALLLVVYICLILMASQVYVIETALVARLPMIFYSFYLVCKLKEVKNK